MKQIIPLEGRVVLKENSPLAHVSDSGFEVTSENKTNDSTVVSIMDDMITNISPPFKVGDVVVNPAKGIKYELNGASYIICVASDIPAIIR